MFIVRSAKVRAVVADMSYRMIATTVQQPEPLTNLLVIRIMRRKTTLPFIWPDTVFLGN